MVTTYVDIKTNLDIIIKVDKLEIVREINQHTHLKMEALLRKGNTSDYIPKLNSNRPIEIMYDEEILFIGVLTNAKIRSINSEHIITLEALSASFITDNALISRSFQDVNMTYTAMIKEIIKTYPNGDIIDEASENVAIDKFIMQYLETDWEFFKRMASYFNLGLIPSVKHDTPKLYFGIPSGKDRGKLEEFNHTIQKDIDYYMESSQNTIPEFSELDSVSFIVETEKDFDIGDRIIYKDINLYIKNKRVNFERGFLKFTYALTTKNGLKQPKIYNEKIVGLSLKGKVLEPIQDRVKVHLEIDQEQCKETAWEFIYSTMYTAEGNSGWYVMPEVDDTVLIYFPNREEGKGYGLNSIRVQGFEEDKINDPDIKYFRTIDGKELKFAPDEILITCINGKDPKTEEPRVTYIRLNDSGGIEITSTEPINLISDQNIKIEAKEEVKILAKNEIRLKCKTSQILIDGGIDLASKEIKVN